MANRKKRAKRHQKPGARARPPAPASRRNGSAGTGRLEQPAPHDRPAGAPPHARFHGPRRRSKTPSHGHVALVVLIVLIQLAVLLLALWTLVETCASTREASRAASAFACAILGYDLFDFFNFSRWELWRVRALRPLLVCDSLCVLALPVVAAVGLTLSASAWQAQLAVVFLFVTLLVRARLDALICARMRELHRSSRRPRWGRDLPPRIDRFLARRAGLRLGASPNPIARALRDAAGWTLALRRGPLGGLRSIVTVVLIVVGLSLVGWATVVLGAEVLEQLESHAAPPPAAAREPRASRGTPARAIRTETTPQPATESSEAFEPRSECAAPPGARVPPWARADILHLYLGGGAPQLGPAPGTLVAGCPEKAFTLDTRDGRFVYVLGTAPGQPSSVLSVAVDSRRFGPAIFLAPAARPILHLIHTLGAIGGLRRLSAGSTGQLYPVQTDRGTFLLLRREASQPFSTVPPVVGQAWVGAIARSHRFLWPSAPERVDGSDVVAFETDTTPAAVVYSFSYSGAEIPEPELSGSELEAATMVAP